MPYAPTLGFPLGIYFACATNVERLRGLAHLPVQRFTVANPRVRVSNPPLGQIPPRPLRSLRPIPRFRNGPVPTGPYFVTYVPFVVKYLLPFGYDFAALGSSWELLPDKLPTA